MIEVEVDSEDTALRLAGLGAQMIDFRPFWPLATRVVRTWFEKQFHSEGAYSGDSWAPLSPVYGAWKAAHHPGGLEVTAKHEFLGCRHVRRLGRKLVDEVEVGLVGDVHVDPLRHEPAGRDRDKRRTRLPASRRLGDWTFGQV